MAKAIRNHVTLTPLSSDPGKLNEISSTGPCIERQTWMKAASIFVAVSALYLISRSPSLDEFDSVNFAMGVHHFNLWESQPHPPGYPLFIFLGWIGWRILGVEPETSLHFVAALGGGLFVAAWFAIIRLQFNEKLAWWIAACVAITPAVWMTATKVLSDSLAAGFLSAEILAALLFLKNRQPASLLAASLLGAAAAGTRPQLILVVIVVLFTSLRMRRASRGLVIMAAGSLIAGCLVWLLPMWYLQWVIRPELSGWMVYPNLIYGQWQWRLHRPSTYLGAGDWSMRYLGWRFANHFLAWFGLGFGFLKSSPTLIVGGLLSLLGLGAYLFRPRTPEDREFWRFHGPWALVHILVIFISLSGSQRYYLLIFPLLLLAFLQGLSHLPRPWNWSSLVLPVLLLYILVPLAIQNHRDEAPSVRLVGYLKNLYPPSRRKDVVLLFAKARRHAEWYAPEFVTLRDIPPANDLPAMLGSAAVVYTDDPKIVLPTDWQRVPVAVFERSSIIYAKDHFVELFLVDRGKADR